MEAVMPKGRIQKGERRSPATEFKKGEHWRKPQAFRDRSWLYQEYVEKKRSSGDIAQQFGVTEAAIFFWLRKHDIPRRTISEARAVKHWGLSGETNGMFGRTGKQNPHWLGGITPERQALYSSQEWAKAVKAVWKRDRHVCQRCGKSDDKMHIHHIVTFAVVELRAEPSNLVLLCGKCHRWVHSRKNVNHEWIG